MIIANADKAAAELLVAACVAILMIAVALLVVFVCSAVVLRAAIGLYNLIARQLNSSTTVGDEFSETRRLQKPRSRKKKRFTVPEPEFGRAMVIMIVVNCVQIIIGVVIGFVSFAIRLNESTAFHIFMFAVSLLTMAAILSAMLPAKIGRAFLVTACHTAIVAAIAGGLVLLLVSAGIPVQSTSRKPSVPPVEYKVVRPEKNPIETRAIAPSVPASMPSALPPANPGASSTPTFGGPPGASNLPNTAPAAGPMASRPPFMRNLPGMPDVSASGSPDFSIPPDSTSTTIITHSSNAKASRIVGGTGGGPFRQEVAGGSMIGVEWSAGQYAGTKAIGQITPVSVAGRPFPGTQQVLAPAGYAVGGINVYAPKFVSHLQLIFMKKNEDGSLDPSDTKLSDWMGGKPTGKVTTLSGNGKPVVGLHGRGTAVIDAIGILTEP